MSEKNYYTNVPTAPSLSIMSFCSFYNKCFTLKTVINDVYQLDEPK